MKYLQDSSGEDYEFVFILTGRSSPVSQVTPSPDEKLPVSRMLGRSFFYIFGRKFFFYIFWFSPLAVYKKDVGPARWPTKIVCQILFVCERVNRI